ncbi:MFS transporter [Ligilactobacillus sp. WILCCON 0076]|uniref:MFS transporter n=1 Tax=Ligilactobacillus ubinensis TaxID=2876789 RepID=A0A9X2JJP6_9LACO|nr:MFS transporter [Ligilactobacillus ubinensis]MCP0885718.1 MFS transporter [Ligilactobacillus ubinensis]
MKIEYHKNIKYSYYYSFFSFFGITGLWVIYLQNAGLTLFEIGLCESIFHIASFLFEVPSGVLADRFSYKTVLVAGRITAILSAIVMLVGHSLVVFALGFILNAFSYNLQSGTIDALMYDSLIEGKQTKLYPKVISKAEIIFEVADTSGVVIAGFFIHWHFALTYVIFILMCVMALVAIFLLQEPLRSKEMVTKKDVESTVTVGELIKSSWKVLKKEKLLRNLMVYQAILDLIYTSYYYYYQSVMKSSDFSGIMISAIILGSSVIAVGAISLSTKIMKRYTQKNILGFLLVSPISLVVLLFVKKSVLMLGLFMLLRALSAIIGPIFSSYYNELIESKQRATLLSVASVLFSATMIIFFPLIGWLIDRSNFAIAFGSLGLFLTSVFLIINLGKKLGTRLKR